MSGIRGVLSQGEVFALSVAKAAYPIVTELDGEEQVAFWGDLLVQIVECASAHIGAEHAQQLLHALRAPGAFTDN